jgi:hypothetical protein
MKNKVFLGGTCAQSTWRDELMPMIQVDYFNPVVPDWTPALQQVEYDEKEHECNIHLYVITKEMMGVFSIAEVIDSVHTPGKITILHVIKEGFEKHELKSLIATVDMVHRRGGIAYVDNEIQRTARVLNNCFAHTL